MFTRKLIAPLVVAATAVTALAACGQETQSATSKDQSVVADQLSRYQKNQPVPQFDYSQYRQTLIDVESAEVHGTATTTFFFHMGVQTPFTSCPSIGFPLPSTAQLTNPDQVERHYDNGGGNVVIPQQETNGVYTGSSTGTYVVCVQPNGTKRIDYWEGDVYTTGGPAHWDGTKIVSDGTSTVTTKGN